MARASSGDAPAGIGIAAEIGIAASMALADRALDDVWEAFDRLRRLVEEDSYRDLELPPLPVT